VYKTISKRPDRYHTHVGFILYSCINLELCHYSTAGVCEPNTSYNRKFCAQHEYSRLVARDEEEEEEEGRRGGARGGEHRTSCPLYFSVFRFPNTRARVLSTTFSIAFLI
jgi:hypothetical protein